MLLALWVVLADLKRHTCIMRSLKMMTGSILLIFTMEIYLQKNLEKFWKERNEKTNPWINAY